MLLSNFFAWVTVISFLMYLPMICYLDWKYRDIKTHKIWLPLLAVNLPFVIGGYLLGTYPAVLLIPAIAGVIAWFLLERIGILPGGDFVFLSLISLFVAINPISGNPFVLGFTIYLVVFTAASLWYILIDNLVNRHKFSLQIERGLPFLIPISCAFIFAVVMG